MKKLLYIGNKLAQHGATPTTIDTLGPLFEKEGYSVKYASTYSTKVWRLADMVGQVFRNRDNVDYVLIDTYSTSNFWYAVLVGQFCRMLSLNYIPLLHGGNLPKRLEQNPKWCQSFFGRAHRIVAPSKYLLAAFESKGFRCEPIPNSIEVNDYRFQKRESIRPKVLWVRSFAKIYNPRMAVTVFHQLKKEYPDADLCMIGPDKDGSLVQTQQYAQELGLTIDFPGMLSKKEWVKRAKEYDVFINTSNFDNMPVSLIEAMCLGLPVVSTDVGGIPHLIHHGRNGLTVPANDADAMTAAIRLLIEDSQQAQAISTAAYLEAQHYDWEYIRDKWFEILQ